MNDKRPPFAIQTILALPWRTVHLPLRWLGGGIGLLLCLVGAGVAAHVGGAGGWRYGMMWYAFGVGYFWMCVMACLLLVAIDARRSRLPGIERAVTGSVLLYALASMALPLAMFVPMGGDAATIVLVAALAASAGMASPLLPRYFNLVFALLWALAFGLRQRLHIPMPGQPGFVPLGLAVLVVLVAACLLRWRYLVRAEAPAETGLGSSAVLQYRQHGGMGGGLLTDTPTRRGKAAGSTWNGPASSTRLDGIGPHTPVRALRVAMGAQFAPQTWRGHARRFLRIGLPLLAFIPLMAIAQAGDGAHDSWHKALLGMGISAILWLGLMGGTALMAATALSLRARWRRPNGELPLLALLPGLGHAEALRRSVVHAALGRALALHLLLLAVVLGAALAIHAGAWLVFFVALAQLGFAGTGIAATLKTLGGGLLPGWGLSLLLIGMTLLAGASTFGALFATLPRAAWMVPAEVMAGSAAAWTLAAALLAWLGWCGWQGLHRQPHPFLSK